MFFAGWASTVLILPLLADKFGRKWIVFPCTVLMAIVMILMTFVSHSIDFTISLVFMAGMATSGTISAGYCYAQEFFTPKYKILYGFSYNSLEGIIYIFQTIYFAYLFKQSLYISSFGCVMAVISVIALFFYVPESPLWQLKMGRLAETKQTMSRVMQTNGAENWEDDIQNLDLKI